jgi:hypothetical protein
MMETKKLRQADFVTSIMLMSFAGWILYQSFRMPMRDTYGGVKNVWYVSPALLPLVVGSGILILSIVLLIHSIRSGGAADLIAGMKTITPGIREEDQRFLAVLLALISFVYLFIPRVDFVLSIALFLSYFIPAFYYDSLSYLKRLSAVYGGVIGLFLLLFMSGAADGLNGVFEFSTDVIALISIVGLNVYSRLLVGSDRQRIKQFRISLLVTVITPLFLTPIFRFLLFVRLPHEGGIVQLLQLIWYSLR